MRVAGSPIFLGSPGATSSTPESAAVRSHSVSLTPVGFATRGYRAWRPGSAGLSPSTLPGVDQRYSRARVGGTGPFAKRFRAVVASTAVALTRSAGRDGAGTSTPWARCRSCSIDSGRGSHELRPECLRWRASQRSGGARFLGRRQFSRGSFVVDVNVVVIGVVHVLVEVDSGYVGGAEGGCSPTEV